MPVPASCRRRPVPVVPAGASSCQIARRLASVRGLRNMLEPTMTTAKPEDWNASSAETVQEAHPETRGRFAGRTGIFRKGMMLSIRFLPARRSIFPSQLSIGVRSCGKAQAGLRYLYAVQIRPRAFGDDLASE